MPQLTSDAPKGAKKERMSTEMKKFKQGTLRSSSGDKVVSRDQAIAIGLSESGQSKVKVGKKNSIKMPRRKYTIKTSRK